MAARVSHGNGRFPAKGLIPEERNVDALESRQPDVVTAKVLDVTNAVNDDRSPVNIEDGKEMGMRNRKNADAHFAVSIGEQES